MSKKNTRPGRHRLAGFGEVLAYLWEQRQLTKSPLSLRSFARFVGVTHATLIKWNRGEVHSPKAQTVERLEEAYGVPRGRLQEMAVFQRKDSPFWWMWLEGTRPPVRISTGIPIGPSARRKQSRADADDIYRAAMGDLARGTFKLPKARPSITFRAFAEWYQQNVVSGHRGKTKGCSMLRALVRVFGDRPLREVTTPQIAEWKATRATTLAHSTVNRELDVLKAMLKRAVPQYLDTNPAQAVRKFPARLPPITILSEDAEDALLAVASPAERALMLLGLDALLRFSDARRLQVVHDRGDHLMIVDPKTSPYKVPVSSRLRFALDVLEPKGGFYFPRKYAGRWEAVSATTAFNLFRALCVRANVPTGRKLAGITFHGLRHTGATRASRVVKLTVVQRLGGWKSLTQLARYDHPDDPESIRAVEAIGSRVVSAPEERKRGA